MAVVVFDDEAAGDPIKIEVDGTWDGELASVYDQETRQNPLSSLHGISKDLLREGLELVRSCAESAHGTLARMPRARRPDEMEVQLAVKLDASVGAVLAKSSAGAQLQVVLRWKKPAQDPVPGVTGAVQGGARAASEEEHEETGS